MRSPATTRSSRFCRTATRRRAPSVADARPRSAELSGTVTRLGVLGWPVAHSRSPAMQNAALARRRAGRVALPAAARTAGAVRRDRPSAAGRRLPGRQRDDPAQGGRARTRRTTPPRGPGRSAPPTRWSSRDGEIHADNTDAPALIAALPFSAAGRTALVLGAGGSARAAVWALLDAGAAEVRVWNRTPARAQRSGEEIGGAPVAAEIGPADLLVHCTSSRSGRFAPDVQAAAAHGR